MTHRLVGVLGVLAALIATEAHAGTKIIVLAPDVSSLAPMLLQHIAASAEALGPNDQLQVYVARPFSQIAEIRLPSDPSLRKARINAAVALQFKPIQTFFASPPAPSHPEPALNIGIPFVIKELAQVLQSLPDKRADVMLVGSWLFWDRRDQSTSMHDRFVPNDQMLRLPGSPFGVVGAQDRLVGSTIHFLWPNGHAEFESAPQEEKVRRWWSIWTHAQQGRVGTMTFDPVLAFKRFNAGESSGQPSYTPSRDGKPEMIRVGAVMPAVLPASFDTPSIAFLRDDAPISKTPPATTKGAAWIGIKWGMSGCDLDLYARSDPSSPWLFFGNGRSPDGGRFNRDWTNAPGEGSYEFIEFSAVDLGKAEAFVNVYSSCEAAASQEVTIRIWFSSRIYEQTLKTGRSGNRGALPMTGAAWTRVNLLKVVGLNRE